MSPLRVSSAPACRQPSDKHGAGKGTYVRGVVTQVLRTVSCLMALCVSSAYQILRYGNAPRRVPACPAEGFLVSCSVRLTLSPAQLVVSFLLEPFDSAFWLVTEAYHLIHSRISACAGASRICRPVLQGLPAGKAPVKLHQCPKGAYGRLTIPCMFTSRTHLKYTESQQ